MNRPVHAYTCQCQECCPRVYRASLECQCFICTVFGRGYCDLTKPKTQQAKAQEKPKKIYLIGSLRNPTVRHIAEKLRALGFEVFDDWHAAGHDADDKWQEYETARGRTYKQALAGHFAKTAFNMDKTHLEASDIGVLVMPAGKSGHLELGYMLGAGKPAFILFDKEPERFDLMYQFATGICFSEAELMEELNVFAPARTPTYRPYAQTQEAREQDSRDERCQCGSRCRELANCRYQP